MITQFSRFARRAVYNFKTKCVSAEIAAICKMRDDRVSSSPQSKSRAEADLYTQSPDRLRQGLTPHPVSGSGALGFPLSPLRSSTNASRSKQSRRLLFRGGQSLFLVSSRPESAKWRDPGFRPRANWHCLNPTRLSPFPHGKGVGVRLPRVSPKFSASPFFVSFQERSDAVILRETRLRRSATKR
jgi:hypothetical protein